LINFDGTPYSKSPVFALLTFTEIMSFLKNKLTLLMMNAVIWCCVFNLAWA